MAGELVYEIAPHAMNSADAHVTPVQPWVRLKFGETACTGSDGVTVGLGLASPMPAGEAAVRTWRRDGTADGDARIIVDWLHGNARSLGVDTGVLVQLFIETAVHPRHDYCCDGEFLATLAGAAGHVGTTTSSRWRLTLQLIREVVDATLAAIADSDSRWRYAIVAARDPESPAGRVRQRLLADLGG